ncbi:MAG: aldo/keto reductase [Planctomycetes bacterium]|nr:aldo/keto reductase [Planctomycetota bacterium]
MQTRKLGRTGLEVSPVSYGASPLGGVFGDVREKDGIACVQRAIDLGVNLIDVSPYYGHTQAETVLGKALAGGWRDKVILCTKAGRIADEEFDFSAKHITRSVDESLRRLRTDHVDVLQAHDIEHAADYQQVFSETAETLHRLKEQGKCRYIGMTGYPLGILRQAIERCNLDVVLSYCRFSLQDTTLLDELLPVAEQHGVGVINASPLSMGLLSEKGPPPWHPAPPLIKSTCRAAVEHCRSRGVDLAFLAMQFVLRDERVATTLVGTSSAEKMERNVRALSEPIDEQLLAEVQKILAPVKDASWPSGNWG